MCCFPLSLYMQAIVPVPVHEGYWPCTCKLLATNVQATWWLSHSSCIGRQWSTSGFFSSLYLVLEKASHWTRSSPESAKLTGQQEYKQHPPVSASPVVRSWVCATVPGVTLCECPGKKSGPYACRASKHCSVNYLLGLSILLKKTFIFLSLIGLPNPKCSPSPNYFRLNICSLKCLGWKACPNLEDLHICNETSWDASQVQTQKSFMFHAHLTHLAWS